MKKLSLFSLVFYLILTGSVFGIQSDILKLPSPDMQSGKPLMSVLKNRKTTRSFSTKDVPIQVLSNLLWAAFGINRLESGGRTAPSAHNSQDIDIYIINKFGIYLYQAKEHQLKKIADKDLRKLTGFQEFAWTAPINLILVSDSSKMSQIDKKEQQLYGALDAGCIAQNIYLFCSSFGLGTVARAYLDKEDLSKAMQLKKSQTIVLAQTVGYPKQ
jgi:SagB-type dehydrogenase family enzyme